MTLLDVNRNDFQNFINFMYLREREREISHLKGCSPNACSNRTEAGQKQELGTQSSLSHGGPGHKYLILQMSPSKSHISRKLESG